MATAAKAAQLPLFYNDLVALNSRDHGAWRGRTTDKAKWLVDQHVVPLTVDEFVSAQRHFPIVFSSGENMVPLALMGLNEGVNVFVGEDGALPSGMYVPAYARRYPYMLAKVSPASTELSLCFDPTTDLIGKAVKGEPLFANDEPTEASKQTLAFCEQFELAGQRTSAFVAELAKHGLLMEGELTITQADGKPYVYRGFQMVDEAKLRELGNDLLGEWVKNGMLTLILAHLMSLELAREIFDRQAKLGKGPA